MIELAVFLILLVTTAVAWLYARDAIYPPVVLGATWSVTVFAYLAYTDRSYPLTDVTGSMVVVGFVAFFLGTLATAPRLGRNSVSVQGSYAPPTSSGAWLLWAALGGLPLFTVKAWSIAAAGPTESLLVNLRLALTEAGTADPFGGLKYLMSIAVLGAGIHAVGLVRTTRARTVAMVTVALAYSFLSTGRTAFLTLIVAIAGGLLVTGRIRIRTALAFGGLAFVSVFALMAFLLGKGVTGEPDLLREIEETFLQYLLGGLAGLNDYLKEAHPLAMGENSLRFVVAVLAWAGFEVGPRELIQEFRWVPFLTNVYTVHRAYFEDFGWVGIVASQFLFGAIHGHVYSRARLGSRVHALFYGLLLYPLLMQVFQDQYLSLLSSWVQALILVALVRVPASLAALPKPESGGCLSKEAPPLPKTP